MFLARKEGDRKPRIPRQAKIPEFQSGPLELAVDIVGNANFLVALALAEGQGTPYASLNKV